jgi:hypothetical protein
LGWHGRCGGGSPIASLTPPAEPSQDAAPGIAQLLAHREVRAIVLAKFLSDGAWYFYLFWLPKYLFEAHHFDLKQAATIGWIPYAASGVGSLCGGFLSSRLLASGYSVNAARKIALGLSAACMPWVMLAPSMASVGAVIAIFSLAFFGQQSWSTLVMTLPTDLAPRSALGRLPGWSAGRRLWRHRHGAGRRLGAGCGLWLWAGAHRGRVAPSDRLRADLPCHSPHHATHLHPKGSALKITEIRTRVVQWEGETVPLPPHFCTNPMDLVSPCSPPRRWAPSPSTAG